MGTSQSVPGVSSDWGTEGFHVLQTQYGSPAFHAGIEPYFDFIVAINDTRLDTDANVLHTILHENLNKPVQLCIYSSKHKRLRYVEVTPSTDWGGPGFLGISIRFCSFAQASEILWHVTKVLPGSPADAAGLISDSDYIIGSDNTLYHKEDLLSLIELSDRKPIRLFCYNSDTDATREVILTPDSNWPGEGSLGCHICTGYLHQIPSLDSRPDTSKRASTIRNQSPLPSSPITTKFQSVFAGDMIESDPPLEVTVKETDMPRSNNTTTNPASVYSVDNSQLTLTETTRPNIQYAQSTPAHHNDAQIFSASVEQSFSYLNISPNQNIMTHHSTSGAVWSPGQTSLTSFPANTPYDQYRHSPAHKMLDAQNDLPPPVSDNMHFQSFTCVPNTFHYNPVTLIPASTDGKQHSYTYDLSSQSSGYMPHMSFCQNPPQTIFSSAMSSLPPSNTSPGGTSLPYSTCSPTRPTGTPYVNPDMSWMLASYPNNTPPGNT